MQNNSVKKEYDIAPCPLNKDIITEYSFIQINKKSYLNDLDVDLV